VWGPAAIYPLVSSPAVDLALNLHDPQSMARFSHELKIVAPKRLRGCDPSTFMPRRGRLGGLCRSRGFLPLPRGDSLDAVFKVVT